MAEVILVNDRDDVLGTMEKMEAHRKGLLHRAFSVFIFNPSGEMLLQQRAMEKYHSPGLWTNACCSHPMPGEATAEAASRRLFEELRIRADTDKIFNFTYRADFENGLTEHEFDHVFAGVFDGTVHPDPDEVMDIRYVRMDELEKELQLNPEHFTVWFRLAFASINSWHASQRWNDRRSQTKTMKL